MKVEKNSNVEKLVLNLSVELLKIPDLKVNDLWPLHPGNKASAKFSKAKHILDEIFDEIRKQNDEVSDVLILEKLLYEVAAIRLQLNVSDSELSAKCRKAIENLLNYKAKRNIDIPIQSLDIGNEPFEFGPITFFPFSENERKSDFYKEAAKYMGRDANRLLLSYARVNVPGDSRKSITFALDLVKRGLLLLRGAGFPIISDNIHQFGIVNEHLVFQSFPIRQDQIVENVRLDAHSNHTILLGPSTFPYRLKTDIINNISNDRLMHLINAFTEYSSRQSPTVIVNKIISGFLWLGEATKPDILSSRFAKLAFSLESFIGGESGNEYLSSRGIKAMLAERAAFLVGNDLTTRKSVDKGIRTFYDIRSKIAHGFYSKVKEPDFEKFGLLVREIGWNLLEKRKFFSNLDELQSWINDQKFS